MFVFNMSGGDPFQAMREAMAARAQATRAPARFAPKKEDVVEDAEFIEGHQSEKVDWEEYNRKHEVQQ